MLSRFLLILLSSFLFVVGCSSTAELMEERVADLPLSERAYLLGKFTVNCRSNRSGSRCMQHFNSISLSFKSEGQEELSGVINSTVESMFGGNTEHDIVDSDNGELSYYFCMPMPAGRYSFYSYRYWDFGGGGSGYYLEPDGYFDVPFFLPPGELSLVDSLMLTSIRGEGTFGIPVYGPGQLHLSALPQEEIELAVQRCPVEVREFPVHSLGLHTKDHGSDLVVSMNE